MFSERSRRRANPYGSLASLKAKKVAEENPMNELGVAITVVEVIVGAVVAMLLGDYLGYKIGRWRLAAIVGVVALVSIIGFAVYAAVVLA